MTSRRLIGVLSLVGSALAAGAGRQGVDDPLLRAAVEKYFAMQAAEDVEGYLALWSANAQKPRVEQLKFVFQTGDDTFSDITILKAVPASEISHAGTRGARRFAIACYLRGSRAGLPSTRGRGCP